MSENMPLSDVIKTSLENIKNVIDTSTVIGEPITVLEDTVIIPVSKVSVGFASGGAEYNGKKDNQAKNPKFGGGGGTGLTVNPVAFLIVNKSGDVRMLNVDENSGYSGNEGYVGMVAALDEFINRAPDMLEKFKFMFGKKKNEKQDEEPENEELKEE